MKICSVAILLLLSLLCQAQVNPQDVTIVRDQWGVPHIHGKTDADAAYGLAWAEAEDCFPIMQETLLATKGQLASVKGKEGAIQDFIAFLIDTKGAVDDQMDGAMSPEFRKVAEAYVQGINDYAAQNPKEVYRKKVFPVSVEDLMEGYILSLTFMTNVQYDLIRIFENLFGEEQSPLASGSNGIAVSSSRTVGGDTYLVANSHQPLKGPYAWYEAHVVSDEGWNMLGGTFPSAPTIFVGANPNLAWTHTVNYPDLTDVYELEMHPTNKLQYKYDGEWKTLEKRRHTSMVKVLGPFKIPVPKTFYWSEYGPTVKNKNGFFSIRFPARWAIKAAEQWFRMNKASSKEEFMEAVEIQGLPGLNIIYADKEDNIFFLGNGLFPYRDPAYNWMDVLPGNTSRTKWAPEFMPLDSLVMVSDPKCGYVYNSNNTPFDCTAPDENPLAKDYPKTIGYLQGNTARASRFQELMAEHDKLSYEQMLDIKYDLSYPSIKSTRTLQNLHVLFNLSPEKYPDLADIIAVLKKWDYSTDVKNMQAAAFTVSVQYLLKYMFKAGLLDKNNDLQESTYADALRFSKKHLMRHFGKLEVELGKVQVHKRGDVEFGIWGAPEVLAAMYTLPGKKGKFESFSGDSYILIARFTDEGVVLETVNCYGASSRKKSPHYTDQMEMFVKQERKPMTLDWQKVMKEAKRQYHPGE